MGKLLYSFILVAALVLASCGGSNEPTKGDAIVYVAAPLSGVQANGGQSILGGARLAAEELNRSGGLLGYKIIVRELDDESNSDVALENVQAVQEAVANGDNVIGVIGHLNSGQTLTAMEHYKAMELVVITPTASEQSLTQRGYTNFFRANANDAVQAVIDAEFLVADLNAQRVAILYNDTPYGIGLAETLRTELTDRGAETLLFLEVEEGQTVYSSEVSQVQAANPDAIFFAGYDVETRFLRAEVVEAGLTMPMLASDGAFLGSTIDESNGTAEGMYVSAFSPSPRMVADDRWFEAYQAVEYRNPDNYSINGYLAMQLLLGGIQEADTFTSNAVANALRSNSFETILDTISYEENGDLVDPQIWIYQVVDGEFKQVQ